MNRLALLLLVPALGSCGSLPRDQSGTMDRIREEGVVRVGMIGGPVPPSEAARLRTLVERSAAATGGRALVLEDAAEPLLLMLEEGELDLVVGAFDRSTPWSTRVHLLPPLARERRGKAEIETTAAARNGENAWIMLLEREAKALSSVQQ
jgi:hypothetical protein